MVSLQPHDLSGMARDYSGTNVKDTVLTFHHVVWYCAKIAKDEWEQLSTAAKSRQFLIIGVNSLVHNWAASWQNEQLTERPAKAQINLGIRPVWSESSLCAQWVAKDPSFLHVDSEDPAKTQINLGICLVWSESLLCAQWVAKDRSFLHVGSEDPDQTGWMPRLIWILAGRTSVCWFCHKAAPMVHVTMTKPNDFIIH